MVQISASLLLVILAAAPALTAPIVPTNELATREVNDLEVREYQGLEQREYDDISELLARDVSDLEAREVEDLLQFLTRETSGSEDLAAREPFLGFIGKAVGKIFGREFSDDEVLDISAREPFLGFIGKAVGKIFGGRCGQDLWP
ncbi:hypothetical protein NLJ89_g5521 [Agrocybe chaxingu]|uniref:Uncharacterized protein n=1 Tax=Agrocybe chaxingu TaxID=84603 RepID=A0A9W8MUX9_9AGAR|nr:hypothetical protein NLJ89_g5521 [Agrocybe chaxingu]